MDLNTIFRRCSWKNTSSKEKFCCWLNILRWSWYDGDVMKCVVTASLLVTTAAVGCWIAACFDGESLHLVDYVKYACSMFACATVYNVLSQLITGTAGTLVSLRTVDNLTATSVSHFLATVSFLSWLLPYKHMTNRKQMQTLLDTCQ